MGMGARRITNLRAFRIHSELQDSLCEIEKVCLQNHKVPFTVVYAYNPSYSGDRSRGSSFKSGPGRPFQKIKEEVLAVRLSSKHETLAVRLSSKHETLSWKPSITKNSKNIALVGFQKNLENVNAFSKK
jgi:hypothetical protein